MACSSPCTFLVLYQSGLLRLSGIVVILRSNIQAQYLFLSIGLKILSEISSFLFLIIQHPNYKEYGRSEKYQMASNQTISDILTRHL